MRIVPVTAKIHAYPLQFVLGPPNFTWEVCVSSCLQTICSQSQVKGEKEPPVASLHDRFQQI